VCETLSRASREEHRPRVTENTVLRLSELNGDEVTVRWTQLNLYSLIRIIRMVKLKKEEMGRPCSTNEEEEEEDVEEECI
jgi:hypothetical protein